MEAAASIKADAPVPRHIAIIMDGNGRWAKQRHLPRIAGHRAGAEAVRKAVKGCIKQGVDYLTVYAFSSENWSRPQAEVQALMGLLRLYISQELGELRKNGVMLKFIGDRDGLPDDIAEIVAEGERATQGGTKLQLTVALNYGAQTEMVNAVRSLARAVRDGKLDPDTIDETMLSAALYTDQMPDPDLIIRTSGEQRLSNFLLWQSAYAELLFLECNWPEFDETVLAAAIQTFQQRERRYGAR